MIFPRRVFLAFLSAAAAVFSAASYAQNYMPLDLSVSAGDVWVSQAAEGGYHLYIRKKPDIASVLLVETTRDPALREPNYAYRISNWNSYNGDELRILNGQPLPQTYSWSLIDSTTEFVSGLLPGGAVMEVFHIYVPFLIQYGYPESRNGEVYVGNGTYFNIRAFTLPYGDYNGYFKDNPFVLEITQEPLSTPLDINYMRETEDSFERISRLTGGVSLRSIGPNDIVETIGALLANEAGEDVDVVICLDTTASMRDDINALRSKLVSMARDFAGQFKSLRVGMVLYRDYKDLYITKVIPWTSDLNIFQRALNAAQAGGGGDTPEAVHEALYDGITKFVWRETSPRSVRRIVILIGDAPPHLQPRGDITETMVIDAARGANVRVNSIILPNKISKPKTKN